MRVGKEGRLRVGKKGEWFEDGKRGEVEVGKKGKG